MRVHLLHIPKTGGMTAFCALQQAGVDITRSHDPGQMPDGGLIISLVREPVARVLSLWRYHERQRGVPISLTAFVRREPTSWWWGVEDVQARMIDHADPDRLLVGFTNRLDELIRRVCALAQVDYPAGYASHNVAPPEAFGITESICAEIEVRNQRDMALYASLVGEAQ